MLRTSFEDDRGLEARRELVQEARCLGYIHVHQGLASPLSESVDKVAGQEGAAGRNSDYGWRQARYPV